MYLILNGRLKGFSEEEVRIMANIARYHRKGCPKSSHPEFEKLSSKSKPIVRMGAAFLRIADGLDRSHNQVVSSVRCRVVEDEVRVSLETRGDAALEIWGAKRKRDLFEEVFGKSVKFKVAGS
jgi:exopolyphosphatase/guanosine-5'-triphosphate,3'-diphosphate pyrophosphatase